MTTSDTTEAARTAEETINRIVSDIAMFIDKPIAVQSMSVELVPSKPIVTSGGVHVAFKLSFQYLGQMRFGALLTPLPDAIAIACHLMMIPDAGVKDKRSLTTLDAGLKDALYEVGNLVGGAADAALRNPNLGLEGIKVRSEGCRSVKPGKCPTFELPAGSLLTSCRVQLRVHCWPAFDAMLMLPALAKAPPPPLPS